MNMVVRLTRKYKAAKQEADMLRRVVSKQKTTIAQLTSSLNDAKQHYCAATGNRLDM